MWNGFDPDIWRNLATFREMVALRYQTPTREWPLLYIEEHDVLLVVREWPDGSVTSYTMTRSDLESRTDGKHSGL